MSYTTITLVNESGSTSLSYRGPIGYGHSSVYYRSRYHTFTPIVYLIWNSVVRPCVTTLYWTRDWVRAEKLYTKVYLRLHRVQVNGPCDLQFSVTKVNTFCQSRRLNTLKDLPLILNVVTGNWRNRGAYLVLFCMNWHIKHVYHLFKMSVWGLPFNYQVEFSGEGDP